MQQWIFFLSFSFAAQFKIYYMTQYSYRKQAEQTQINQFHDSQRDGENLISEELTSRQEAPRPSQRRQEWSLKAKAIIWALAVSMIPVLTVGTATYYFGRQSVTKQIPQARQADVTDLRETKLTLDRELSLLLIGTGVTSVLAGAIAAILANRAIRPVLNAATVSTTMVNRLRRESQNTRAPIDSKDELVVLEKNISLIKERLPDLLWKQETADQSVQVLRNITCRIQESLNEEDVLKTTVEEVRTALKTDRVAIFRFNPNWDGTFVAESVAFGFPKVLWSTVSDPCFEEEHIEQYNNGHIRAVDDIYKAGLTDCYIGLLERFAVKSNLIAPILKNNQLFGLLIAHECSKPRSWLQSEIGLFAQVATQVGFALKYVKLLEQVETKADQDQVFINTTRCIRESLNEEDVLKATVEEVRKEMSADRVLIYGFDSNWYGTVIAESVLPGFPKALRANIKDPCFAEGYVEKYQGGRVQATNNIYEAGLTTCHISQLERFAVKANLVAPILKDNQLFALLIAHQCSKPRNWQQSEIDLFTQIATQVGFALDHARLLQRIDAEGVRMQMIMDLTRHIREPHNEEDVLKITVEGVRKAMSADRVIVYGFDANWFGTVIAESVVTGFPKALRAKIEDPCFAEGYVVKYRMGRVQATNNIYDAGLTACHISQLEKFAVKAGLVAPILKDDQLFGLLIAHQCSKPRHWGQSEIDFLAQIATQVGFALDHARLLDQVEDAYQSAEAIAFKQRQQQEEFQRQVSELLSSSEVVQALSTEVSLDQIESFKSTYEQIQTLADSAWEMVTSAKQIELQEQQLSQTVQNEHESVNRILDSISAIRETFVEASVKVKRLDQPSQKLSEMVNLISHVVSQIKLQALHTTLEASRSGEAGQKFALNAEKELSLVQQLDSDIAQIKPLIGEIQAQTNEVIATMQSGTERTLSEAELVEKSHQKIFKLATISDQIKTLVMELAQAAAVQAQTSTSANQSILQVANIASQTSEQAVAVADSVTKLAAFAQDLQKSMD